MTLGPNVPRGTKPTTQQIQELGTNYSKLSDFADILERDGVRQGLIGPKEVERLWDRHILNCAALSELITDGQSIIDIGSGAGLPGLVLAILKPNSKITLVEPMQRRCNFLTIAMEELGLSNVEVLRGRAETQKIKAQIVTSRAVAPLNKLLLWSIPLLEKGGKVLAIKGEKVEEELNEVKKDKSLLKTLTATIKTCGLALDLSVTVVEVA